MSVSRLDDFAGPRVGGEPGSGIFRQTKIAYQTVEALAGFVDLTIIVIASTLGEIIYQQMGLEFYATGKACLGAGIITGVSYVFFASARGLYRFPVLLAPAPHGSRIVIIWASIAFFMSAFLIFLKDSLDFPPWPLVAALLPQAPLLLLARLVFAKATNALVSAGNLGGRRVVTIGDPAELQGLRADFLLQRFGLHEVCRVAVATNYTHPSSEYLAELDGALAAAREFAAEEFLLALPWGHSDLLHSVCARLCGSPIPVRLLPDHIIRTVLAQRDLALDGLALPVRIQRAAATTAERVVKRLLDILLSLAAIAILWPILVIAAIAIKLESRGPVIFQQQRTGFQGKEFVIFKFRTMRVLEDGPEMTQARRGDNRVTLVGRFLRRSSIDELPQLFNVLKGDMSLVGPRPHPVALDHKYKALIADYGSRFHVKPGLTGWAQVNGSRGETAAVQQMAERVKLDLWYVGNWSFGLDLQILCRTCFEVLRDQAY
jgi:putative colanic acid biosysnthesis UDP-glucose lipid carrier transferase